MTYLVHFQAQYRREQEDWKFAINTMVSDWMQQNGNEPEVEPRRLESANPEKERLFDEGEAGEEIYDDTEAPPTARPNSPTQASMLRGPGSHVADDDDDAIYEDTEAPPTVAPVTTSRSPGTYVQDDDDAIYEDTEAPPTARLNPAPSGAIFYPPAGYLSDDTDAIYEDTEAPPTACPIPAPVFRPAAAQPADDTDDIYDDTDAPSVRRDCPTVSPPPRPLPREPSTPSVYDVPFNKASPSSAAPPRNPSPRLPSPRIPSHRTLPPAAAAPPGDRSSRPIDYENWYLATWDCAAEQRDELTVTRGDMVRVVSRCYEDSGWWVAELNGSVGIVPIKFLTPAYTLVA
ncbi:PREDICTED: extensin-like [Priapulus caudatus]|uniref:Extensin-like n=1 Tax=Priapulus caudatus TaxID=37621 RepID=A0ABM1F5C0_PRICU|nr:PREDICTED: extensin-like [Priapulus caudatus]